MYSEKKSYVDFFAVSINKKPLATPFPSHAPCIFSYKVGHEMGSVQNTTQSPTYDSARNNGFPYHHGMCSNNSQH